MVTVVVSHNSSQSDAETMPTQLDDSQSLGFSITTLHASAVTVKDIEEEIA